MKKVRYFKVKVVEGDVSKEISKWDIIKAIETWLDGDSGFHYEEVNAIDLKTEKDAIV